MSSSLSRDTRADFRFSLPIAVAVIVVLTGMAYFFLIQSQISQEQQYKNERVADLETSYNQIVQTYELVSATVFEEVINQPDVLSLYSEAYTATPERQDEIRAELFALLQPTYERLTGMNVRQLHFHLPDNTSFLRFHRPDLYGDDLTQVRDSVRTANAELIPVIGFEEGRIYNGFRYVYPLFWEGEHIGSVETSVSFQAIRTEMASLYSGSFTFMLKTEVIESRVFEEEQGNYEASDLSAAYSYDKAMLQSEAGTFPWERLQEINTAISDNVDDRLNRGETFAYVTRQGGDDLIATFLPVNNINGEQVAYIISYNIDTEIARTRQMFFLSMTLTTLVAVGIALFFIQENRRRNQIRGQRDQLRTQNEALVKANRELAVARKQAEAVTKLKSQFLATMSHELRTPLNAVIGYSQLQLAGMVGEMSEEQSQFQERILVNAQHLLQLINEVLDLSKIEAGRMDLVEKPFDLRECLEEVILQNKVLAENKALLLTLKVDERLPQTIVGDRGRIKQIIINLVSNAVKFTDSGTVTVDANLYNKQNWRITVTDTGVGIAPHLQETIFDEFRQAEHGIDRGGTGLGLAIVRKLVLMMGGNIRLNSEVGHGSVFTVTLPLTTEVTSEELISEITVGD